MRKNKLLLLLALLMTAATGAWAQTEITTIPNGDFETWTYDGEDMPNYWNSNATSDGSLAAMSGGKQLKRSTDVRPGSSGQYSCSIWSKSTMGVINIGILTSGRIHFGSMSSTNNANYIYSDRDGSNTKNNFTNPCAMPFTGKPTAIKVWVKYVQGGTGYGNYATAKFSATIHGDADYVAYNLAEHDNDDNKALVVASAEQEIAYNNGEWEQITIPFNYTDNDVAPAYILINAYTNAYPGKGKANDYLYIDDIELEYAPEPGIASTYTVTMKDGVKDADKWTVKVGEGQAQALPIGGLKGDGSETVTLTYNGRLKVKSVTATSDEKPAAPAYTLLDNTMTAWTAGSYAVPAGGLTYSDAITVSGDVTLTLTDGETLTLNKGISLASGATLTVEGNGTMNVNGTNENTTSTVAGSTGTLILTSGTLTATGGNGGSVDVVESDAHGGNGGVAINGSVIVSGGSLTARGGNGGSVDYQSANCSGGNGGDAISGSVTVSGGTLTASGGNGGSVGDYGSECSGGNGGDAISGTLTKNGGSTSVNDGSNGSIGNMCDNCTAGTGGTSDAAPAKEPATVTTAPTGAAIVGVGKTTALVSGGAADGGTLMYQMTTTNTKPTSTDGFSDAVPTAKDITASGKVYVWYYVKGDDTHSDSEIAGPVSVTLAEEITWNSTNVFNSAHQTEEVSPWRSDHLTYEDITISFSGESSIFTPYGGMGESRLLCYGDEGDSFTFTAPSGKKFCKIEIINNSDVVFDKYGDWTQPEDNKIVWSGTAANAVTLGTVYTVANNLNSIVFYLSE